VKTSISQAGPLQAWATDACYRILGYTFRVRASAPGCADALERTFGSFATRDSEPEGSYEITDSDARAGTCDLYVGDRRVLQGASPSTAFDLLAWHAMREAVSHSDDFVLVHAGAVSSGGRAIVLPASAGSGKSTLVAGLVRAGMTFYSDEVAAFAGDGTVSAVPRSIVLKPTSIPVFEPPLPALPAETAPFLTSTYPLRPGDIGSPEIGVPAPVGYIVFPEYEKDATTALEPITRAQTLVEMATQCFNLEEVGGRGLEVLARVVDGAGCYRLRVGDLDSAVEAVRSIVEGSGA